MNLMKYAKSLAPAAMLALAFAMPAQAIEVSGIKVDDKFTVGGKELTLNGAGIRQIVIVKVYAIGLYLTQKKTTAEEVQTVDGPRRVALFMQRDIDTDELGQLFITSMNKNSTKEEKAKVINQTVKFGEQFASQDKIKKGDLVTLDWIPGTGTVSSINGKRIGDPLPDVAFYNAVLRIWVGENPVQTDIKRNLLGSK